MSSAHPSLPQIDLHCNRSLTNTLHIDTDTTYLGYTILLTGLCMFALFSVVSPKILVCTFLESGQSSRPVDLKPACQNVLRFFDHNFFHFEAEGIDPCELPSVGTAWRPCEVS